AIKYDLDLDDKGFSSKLSKASDEVKGFSGQLKAAEGASMAFAGALVGIGTAVVGALGMGLKVAGELETLEIALTTVTGSTEDAREAMEKIKQTAIESPFFETSTLAQFVQVMAAAGQEIDEAVASGIGFGDVVAAFGKGNFELMRMGNTLSQVIGKG